MSPHSSPPRLSLRARLGRAWLARNQFRVVAWLLANERGWVVAMALRTGLFDDPQIMGALLVNALLHARENVVRVALARGGDPNGIHQGDPCLHWAILGYCLRQHTADRAVCLRVLSMLLEHGADLERFPSTGKSACKAVGALPEDVQRVFRAEHARREGVALEGATNPALAAVSLRRL